MRPRRSFSWFGGCVTDRTTGTPSGVASWAARNGYQVGDMGRYEQLVADGVTAEQAAQGYGTIRQLDETVGRIASVYGESFSQADAEQDVFFNKNEKRRRIMSQEAATFGGSSRGATGSAHVFPLVVNSRPMARGPGM